MNFRIFTVLFFVLSVGTGCSSDRPVTTEESAYQLLDTIRDEKAQQLQQYKALIFDTAEQIRTDTELHDLFDKKLRAYTAYASGEDRRDTLPQLRNIRDQIEDQYINHYLLFNDLMFISPAGDVFFTLKKGGDYHHNVFNGELGKTGLSVMLQTQPQGGFVDFETYPPSGRPFSFLIVEYKRADERLGWFVFKLSISRINDMFAFHQDLGATGEIILVNRSRQMLTDSKFRRESTILDQELSPENIEAKFAARTGHKVVTDYRGRTAISSFKVIDLNGSEWLLIAKIDRSEIVTGRFLEQANENLLLIERELLNVSVEPLTKPILDGEIRDIAWDEFGRASSEDKELLYTHGVRTCTAIIISLPGSFSYVAHLSANDRLYGGDKTDLLAILRKRIDNVEITETQKRDLTIAIISPKPQYSGNVVEALLKWGVLTSQIKLVFNGASRHANIYHDLSNNETYIDWKGAGERGYQSSTLSQYPSIEEVYLARKSSKTSI